MATSNPTLYNGKSSKLSVYETTTVKNIHPIGTPAFLEDGRRFHYAKLVDSTAIGKNKLAQSCPPVANHVTQTGTLTGMTTVGATSLSATLGATAAYVDEYENGYFKIQSATTGAGQIFRVPTHAAVLSAGVLSFQSPDGVMTATSGTTTWSLIHNPWASVVIQPDTVTANAAGVTLCDWAAAASTSDPVFGWLQTWGLCSVLIDTTAIVAGSGVIAGAVAGALGVAVETDILQRVAVGVEAIGTDNIYASVFLNIS
jgi:hypothetical protein